MRTRRGLKEVDVFLVTAQYSFLSFSMKGFLAGFNEAVAGKGQPCVPQCEWSEGADVVLIC